MISFVNQHFHTISEGKRAILTRPFTYFKATPCFKIKENLILLWNPNSNLRGTWCTKQGRGQSLFRVFFSNFPQILPFVYTSLYPTSLNDDTKILTETDTGTFFYDSKFSETETETLKNLAKVSRPRPKPKLLNIFWNEIRKIWDLQAKLEFLGPKFGTLIVNWVKIISAR